MRRAWIAVALIACSKTEPGADASADADADVGRDARASAPLPPGEVTLTLGAAPDAGAPQTWTLRSDGTFTAGAEPRTLAKPTTASVLALADEAVDVCAEAGAGGRAQLVVRHGAQTSTVSHDVADDACTRAISRLERRLLGLR